MSVDGLYRNATRILGMLTGWHLARRVARGKEDPARLGERRGFATAPRPEGFLIWCHAASVGETQSVLTLLHLLAGRGAAILLTTGTKSSAEFTATRLPPGAVHQYVPLDHPDFVARFLDHWRPDLGLFVETEFWPNLILGAAARGVSLALVNARFSAASAKGWRFARALLKRILGSFRVRLAQDRESALRLESLTGLSVTVTGNLKFDAPALRDDPEMREALAQRIGARPFWLAASTQKGEEALLVPAIQELARRHPDLLTIIAPRHPERGEEVAALFPDSVRRSLGQPLMPESRVYVADTLGELGVFYRLAPIVFMGGSLVPHGGQNPIEAARLGAAVTIGPHHWNQADAVIALELVVAGDAGDLAQQVDGWLSSPESLAESRYAISARAAALGPVLPKVMEALSAILPPEQADA